LFFARQVIAAEFYDAQNGLCHKYAEAFTRPNEPDFQEARKKGGWVKLI
jgi:hypothetical protein